MSAYRIPYKKLGQENGEIFERLLPRLRELVYRAEFILRPPVVEFEQYLSCQTGVSHAVGVNSGTDAISLLLKAADIGPGNEVITVSHTFIATVSCIVRLGVRPVLVDVGDDFNIDCDAVERAITPRTRAILPVHMNGRLCQMDRLTDLAERKGLILIEDAAQSLGARFNGLSAGCFGFGAAVSFHPLKLLSAWGDAGALLTNHQAVADATRILRCHGELSKTEYATFGVNSRLDTLQALVLGEKVKAFPELIREQRALAERYRQQLAALGDRVVCPPGDDPKRESTFSNFVIRCDRRDALNEHLRSQGIESMIHWPVPLHKQTRIWKEALDLPTTEKIAQTSLALPIGPKMTIDEVDEVVSSIGRFFSKTG